jgi:hypothetical protein
MNIILGLYLGGFILATIGLWYLAICDGGRWWEFAILPGFALLWPVLLILIPVEIYLGIKEWWEDKKAELKTLREDQDLLNMIENMALSVNCNYDSGDEAWSVINYNPFTGLDTVYHGRTLREALTKTWNREDGTVYDPLGGSDFEGMEGD